MSFELFGDLLRFLRRRARLTQREFGLAVGYSESQISKLEKGHRQANRDVVAGPFIEALKLNSDHYLARRLIELADPNHDDGPLIFTVVPSFQSVSRNGHAQPASPRPHDAAPAAGARANGLPAQLTSFVGREREIHASLAALAAARMVTLVGPGGCGKTRLALRVAEVAAPRYADGVCFVELAPLADAKLVDQAVAATLGITATSSRPLAAGLAMALSSRHMLLVLDNCEQVIDGCADLAELLLRECPRLSILATSREALNTRGEDRQAVPPLSLPPTDLDDVTLEELLANESVRLYVERAQAARGTDGFRLTPDAVRAMARICVLLDGLPLAIELAAALAGGLSVEDILDRLDDRFGLLVAGPRTATPRQQTLASAINWSYSLLSAAERTLFQRLAIFAGGWNLAAAERVCGEVRGRVPGKRVAIMLKALVDKSLVNMHADGRNLGARYSMLETIRQYALDRLMQSPDAEDAARRHAECFLHVVEDAELALFGPAQVHTLTQLEAERANISAALAHFVSRGDAGAALRMVGALRRYWQTRGHVSEGRAWYERAMAISATVPAPVRAKALFTGSVLAYYQNDAELSQELDRQALAAVAEVDDPWLSGQIVAGLVYSSESDDDYRRARARMDAGLQSAQRSGNAWLIGNGMHKLGAVELGHGHFEEAERLLSASASHLMDAGDREFTLVTQIWLGNTALKINRHDRARQAYVAALRLCEQIGLDLVEHNSVWYCLVGLSELAAVARQPLRMARLLGAVERERETLGGVPLLWFVALDCGGGLERYGALSGEAADPVAYDAAWREGRAMRIDRVITYAMEGA
jgi:non-specific serine/threonine protein kinase